MRDLTLVARGPSPPFYGLFSYLNQMPGVVRPQEATTSDWLLVMLLGIIWGTSFLSIAVALDGYGPITVAAGRIALAAVALTVAAQLTGQGLPSLRSAEGRRTWIFACGLALFSNALPFFLLAWGQQYVTSAFAGITMATVPLFVLALAHAFVPGERLTAPRVVGFLFGLSGVVLLLGGNAFDRSEAELVDLARLACVTAAAGYAIGSIVARRAPPIPLVSFSAAALLAASAMIVPLALLVEGIPRAPAAGYLPTLALLYLGLVPTGLATVILVRVVRSAGPGFLTQVNYHVPIWAAIFGVVLLGETLPPQFLAALAVILAGLALSRRR
jgi:drug/metabolite transporter (DMT)-like permease